MRHNIKNAVISILNEFAVHKLSNTENMYSASIEALEVNPFTPANDVTEHNKYSFHAHTYLPFCIDLDHCMTMLGCPHKIA